MQTATIQWLVDSVSQLPSGEKKQLRDYLKFLVWKAGQNKPNKNRMAQKIIESVEHSNDVTMEDALALLKAIEEGKRIVQFNSPFEQ